MDPETEFRSGLIKSSRVGGTEDLKWPRVRYSSRSTRGQSEIEVDGQDPSRHTSLQFPVVMDEDPVPDDPSKSSISNPPSIKHGKLLRPFKPLFRQSGEDDGQYDYSSSLPIQGLLSDEEKETYQKIKRQFKAFNRIKDFLLVMLSSPMTISHKAIYEDVVQDISKIYCQIRKLEADLISKDTDKLEYVKISFQVLSKSIQRLLDDSFLDEIETYIPRNMVQKIFKPLVLPEPLLMEAAVPGKMLEASSSARSAPIERIEMVEKETPQEILESAESSAPVERTETVEKKVPQEILELAVRSAARQISEYIVSKKFQNIRVYGEGKSRVLLVLKKYLQKKYKYARPIFMVNLQHRQSNSLAPTDIAEWMILHALFRKSFILLLDGVSEKTNLKKIRILIKRGALVFTTRSREISPKMQVDVEINMEDHLLAWKLFCDIVGESVHSSTVQHLAISIFEKCGGHLLAVVLMAKYLKNAIDVEAWKKALDELTSSKQPDMNEVVVKAMILNWGQMDILSKHCVRYCASHPKRTWFDKVSLISDWINDGIIFTRDEGKKILESLTCTFLLENIGKGESVMMQEQVYDIFVSTLKDKMHPLILNPSKLKDGEEGFKYMEWGDFRVIDFMDSTPSELPESPNCPILLKLVLQRNYDLIEIPPPFFKHMPVLQVLDLSYTSIRNLPDTLSSLVALRKFLLRGCELFMDLPPNVGELKNLEELDLDKTEIMHLPTEMRNLEKIKVLKVSFYEYMNGSENTVQVHQKIPSGVISNLSQLAELSIDVKQDDQQWDLTMKVIIKEVRGLKMLKTLKLYMPDATLLDDLRWDGKNLIYPYLSHFKFIVGRHKKRIIVRVPREVEAELEKWDKCLKFVYGANVPIEIQKVLGYATAFFLDRHMSVTKLSEIGMENMKNLRFCILAECNQLQTLVDTEECVLESLQYLNIYYMRDLESIWRGPIHEGCLSRLKFLELHTCPELSIVFTPDLLHNLVTLEELVIEDCPRVCNLLVSDATFDSASDCFFPNLKRMSLLYLPELVSISCGSVCFAPKLESIGLYNCPNLINLSTKDFSSKKLKVIKGEQNWWEELQWHVSKRGDQPEHLDRIFSPINNEEDVMTQLEKGGIYFNVQSKNESLLNSQVERKSLIYDTGTSDREMDFKPLISDPVDKGKEMSKAETEARDVGPVATEVDIQVQHMEETLHKLVIGQDDAVKAISWAICRARAGLNDPNRPIASFIFSGPTGVGKSELAKALAILYFGSEEALIRFDMNEFMERQSVSDLIGAPPVYVDYTERGQLTEAVRRRPYTLVLFDQIEKAHPRVLNMIVKILNYGRLTDSKGRTVDFKNTLLIMTSTVGSSEFHETHRWTEFHHDYDLFKSLVTDELMQHFRPELLNRVDDIIVFCHLTELEVKQIADKMLKEVFQRLKTRGIELQVTERFRDRVVEEGDPMYGAWPLRRAIKRLLEDNMAKTMLSREIKEGDSVIVDEDSNGNITVS